jgi:hypothetical protein
MTFEKDVLPEAGESSGETEEQPETTVEPDHVEPESPPVSFPDPTDFDYGAELLKVPKDKLFKDPRIQSLLDKARSDELNRLTALAEEYEKRVEAGEMAPEERDMAEHSKAARQAVLEKRKMEASLHQKEIEESKRPLTRKNPEWIKLAKEFVTRIGADEIEKVASLNHWRGNPPTLDEARQILIDREREMMSGEINAKEQELADEIEATKTQARAYKRSRRNHGSKTVSSSRRSKPVITPKTDEDYEQEYADGDIAFTELPPHLKKKYSGSEG